MNLLDAHRIVNEYVDVFASGKGVESGGAFGMIRRSVLPNSLMDYDWRDKLIIAHQIFFSHAILWNSRTPEAIEQHLLLLHNINKFVDDEVIFAANRDYVLMKSENTLLGRLRKGKVEQAKAEWTEMIKEQTRRLSEPYRYDDVVEIINGMSKYRETVFAPRAKQANEKGDLKNVYKTLVSDYCKETYKRIGVPFEDVYINFFWPFSQMRTWARDDQLMPLYFEYMGYLFSHKD